MSKLKLLLSLIILSLVFSSCETDFPVTGEYVDTTIVYGLLDKNDETHYLKINKAFLGEGNALIFATEPDSNQYEDILDVQLHKYADNGGALEYIESVEFDTTMMHDKLPGAFFAPSQILYKSDADIDDDYIYELDIFNTKTGKRITSSTPVVKEARIKKPFPHLGKILFQSSPEGQALPINTVIEWTKAENGLRYELLLKFKYRERLSTDLPNVVRTKVVDWDGFNVQKSPYDTKMMSTDIDGSRFFTFVENSVRYEDQAMEDLVEKRWADSVEVIISVGGVELNTYLDVNSISTSLVQDKPLYSNIENGIGLFSSRRVARFTYAINGLTINELAEIGMKF